jgi:hypothetical protein
VTDLSDDREGAQRAASALLLAICERFVDAATLYRELAPRAPDAIDDALGGDAVAEAAAIAALGRLLARNPGLQRMLTGELDVQPTIRAIRALGDSLLIRATGDDAEQELALTAGELQGLLDDPAVGGFVKGLAEEGGG